MTYKEYSSLLSAHQSAISLRKSLIMTIKSNKVYIKAYTSMPREKRQIVIDTAEKQLASLIIPPKPEKQPIGYQVLVDGDFSGFIPNDDYDEVFAEAAEFLGHENFTLKAKPRFND